MQWSVKDKILKNEIFLKKKRQTMTRPHNIFFYELSQTSKLIQS